MKMRRRMARKREKISYGICPEILLKSTRDAWLENKDLSARIEQEVI